MPCTSPTGRASPAQLALLAGEVDFNIDNLAAAAPNIKAGKLKALAVTSLDASAPCCRACRRCRAAFKGFCHRHLVGAWWRLPPRPGR